MRKPYPIDGWELEATYARSIHSYRGKMLKFIKRKMNKRFRNPQNIPELEIGLEEYEEVKNPEV